MSLSRYSLVPTRTGQIGGAPRNGRAKVVDRDLSDSVYSRLVPQGCGRNAVVEWNASTPENVASLVMSAARDP